MSDQAQQGVGHPEDAVETSSGEETVDGVPVLSAVRTLEHPAGASLPAVQAAAAAATGFLAGAATIALVRRHGVRKLAGASSASRSPRRAVEALPVLATRTFVVDVHLLGRE